MRMIKNKILLLAFFILAAFIKPVSVEAELITGRDYTAKQVPDLQSQTTYSILVDKNGFVWISGTNGIDCYDGMTTHHYKVGDPEKRSYRDGSMLFMHRDHLGVLWVYSERGVVYRFNPDDDKFETVVDLYSLQKWCSVQALFTTDDNCLVIGTNQGIICYDMEKKTVVSHVVEDSNVRCFTILNRESVIVGADNGMYIYNFEKKDVEGAKINDLPVICLEPVGGNLWIGTRGRGLYYMPKGHFEDLKMVDGSYDLIVNGLAFAENYGLLIGSDGQGLLQLDLDVQTGLPSTDLFRVAYDNRSAIFHTRSGAINDVVVNHGNVWITMYMGGCMRLIPNHNLITLTYPEAESPSDNFVYDLDKSADGDLWVAYNQSIVRYNPQGELVAKYLDRESRFLTMKIMPDSTVWAGGYGTGLHHFDPRTGKREWISSLVDAPVNDCIYDLHYTNDGDLWVGGLNFPLTRMHFLPNGTYEKTHYDVIQISDIESLNDETLVLATSDGIWLLDIKTNTLSHRFLVGDEYEWQGTNNVKSIMTRNGREVWIATAGAGLVCYDVPTDHYDYYDNLDLLPSLELRSVLMLNDSIMCISTEDTGVFSFNCNTRYVMRSMLQEDAMLQQEFIENSGIRLSDGSIIFGGDRGAIQLTSKDIIEESLIYRIFILGPKKKGLEYNIGYRHNNLTVSFCTNDIYHQDDYIFEYRIDGFSDDWLPTTHPRSLTLVNLPAGDWELELRAINSTHMEIRETLHLHVTRPIWQRWYAWVSYILFFFWIVLKIVLYLLRPRIEDM